MVPCLRDYVAMSLRGKEPTEAISCLPDKKEIAALPAGARNDKEVITIPPPNLITLRSRE